MGYVRPGCPHFIYKTFFSSGLQIVFPLEIYHATSNDIKLSKIWINLMLLFNVIIIRSKYLLGDYKCYICRFVYGSSKIM